MSMTGIIILVIAIPVAMWAARKYANRISKQ